MSEYLLLNELGATTTQFIPSDLTEARTLNFQNTPLGDYTLYIFVEDDNDVHPTIDTLVCSISDEMKAVTDDTLVMSSQVVSLSRENLVHTQHEEMYGAMLDMFSLRLFPYLGGGYGDRPHGSFYPLSRTNNLDCELIKSKTYGRFNVCFSYTDSDSSGLKYKIDRVWFEIPETVRNSNETLPQIMDRVLYRLIDPLLDNASPGSIYDHLYKSVSQVRSSINKYLNT